MFEGFSREWIDTGETEIHLVRGGEGPPLLLLHGFPQSHVAWHKVAPALAEAFTLVIPDLRGYGDSSGPAPDGANLAYSKRAMALDMVAVMAALGIERFALAGHDRGGRVAYRLALDHPERVSRLAVLDIVPTLEMAETVDLGLAIGTYHWFFLAQPAPLPERLIAGDPDFYLDFTLDS
jgi:haloacetate dehalogenase